MKRLPFRKVKIVRKCAEVEYSENLCSEWTKYRDSNKLWCYEKKSIDWSHQNNEKYLERYRRSSEKYRRSLKRPGKKMKMESQKWHVLDFFTGEIIEEFDSIEQAKRFCIKNDYDFGMYDK